MIIQKKYDVSAYTINEIFYKFQIPSDNLKKSD